MRASLRWLAPAPALWASLLPGCKVGPDYVPPDVVVPDAWHQAATEGLESGEADLRTWWTLLGDAALDELIRRAGEGNLDLQVAASRIREARAIRGIVAPDLWPTIDAFGNVGGIQLSEAVVGPALGGTPIDRWGLGVDFSWEFDVWGRIRRNIESADAGIEAEVENYRDLLVVLYAEIGLSYVGVRTLQQRIRYAQDNARAQRDSVQLTKDRFNAQIVPELDVRQAELNLFSTEATIPALQQSLMAALHRIAVLIGEHPDAVYDLLDDDPVLPTIPEDILAGVPADVVRRRPDVRRAERQLAAQNAQIGSAKALLYPTFGLQGSLSLEANDLGDVFSSSALAWSTTLPVRWNIFNRGRLYSNIEIQEERTKQLLLIYENTILNALAEVETSIVAFGQEGQRRGYLSTSVGAAEKSVELVKTLYKNGLTNFQNVLDMQRSLTFQQDDLASSSGEQVKNLILLYKALGGGWGGDPATMQAEAEAEAAGEEQPDPTES